MITRDQIAARQDAEALLELHANAIGAAVYRYGQAQTAMTLRVLADIIEASEFKTQTDWVH